MTSTGPDGCECSCHSNPVWEEASRDRNYGCCTYAGVHGDPSQHFPRVRVGGGYYLLLHKSGLVTWWRDPRHRNPMPRIGLFRKTR